MTTESGVSEIKRHRHIVGRKRIARIIEYVVIILCSVCLVYLFAHRNMRFFKIPSASMEPTLYQHDYILTLNHDTYERGDIVVLRDPKGTDEYIVKRIVGVEGDIISVKSGVLFINGAYASEPYVKEPMSYWMPPVSIPENRIFVFGDNRNVSEDSHEWMLEVDETNTAGPGSIPANYIIGKVHFIYFPLRRMGAVNTFPLRNSEGN